MDILKKRISLLLGIVMISLAVVPFIFVNAANSGSDSVTTGEVNVSYNSKVLADRSVTSVEMGSSVVVSASGSDLEDVIYSWDKTGWISEKSSSFSLAVPAEFENGSQHDLYVSARYKNKVTAEVKKYLLIVTDSSIHQVSMNVKMGSTVLKEGRTYIVNGGEQIIATAETSGAGAEISFIGYRYTGETKVKDV